MQRFFLFLNWWVSQLSGLLPATLSGASRTLCDAVIIERDKHNLSLLVRLRNQVERIAQAVHADRAYDDLPVLGDALEEAGCHDAQILGHCHGPGPHVPGCWVVDLVRGAG